MYCRQAPNTEYINTEAVHDVASSAHLFGVLQILEHRILVPCNTLVDVRSCVRETLSLTGLTAENTGAETIENK